MTIDVNEHISAVRRQVGTRTLEAGQARVVTLSRTYGAPVDDVWDACTSVERIPRWFLPITGDLRVGGRYQLQGNAGGTVERCEAPNSFGATWEFDSFTGSYYELGGTWSLTNQDDGWWLDNVSVTGVITSQTTPASDSDQPPGGSQGCPQ